MFRPDTLSIIVGAGASKSVNNIFGTGIELLENIADDLLGRKKGSDNQLMNYLLKEIKQPYTVSQLSYFIKLIDEHRLTEQAPSIDLLLDQVSKLPKYRTESSWVYELGVKCIYFYILKWESQILSLGENMFPTDCWLHKLGDFIERHNSFESGNLQILTFNYDRVIEFYLLQRFNNSENFIKWLKNGIKHIYGSIGDLPSTTIENTDPIPFGEESLFVIYDLNKNQTNFTTLYREEITRSVTVRPLAISLGFGFDFMNWNRIAPQYNNGKLLVHIYSTDDSSKINDYNKIHDIRRITNYANFKLGSCTDFLENYFKIYAEESDRDYYIFMCEYLYKTASDLLHKDVLVMNSEGKIKPRKIINDYNEEQLNIIIQKYPHVTKHNFENYFHP